MANVFVRSAAVGTGTGVDWANAFTTLAGAFTAQAAGDSFFVSEDHAETQASAMALTSPGTAASPCLVYCANHAGTVPPVSADLRTTATISTTGASAISFAGFAYCFGITFNSGSAANAASITFNSVSSWYWSLDNCGLVLNNSSASSIIGVGASSTNPGQLLLNNTPITFGAVGQSIGAPADTRFLWRNTASAIGGSVPTTLFVQSAQRAGYCLCAGVDLSAAGTGKTIVGAINQPSSYVFQDCKLGASVTVAATPTSPGAAETYIIRSDSAGTNYRHEKYSYMGTQAVETTIVRTGGASDGTTGISWKIVTTANSKWILPFEAIPIQIFNATTASNVTVTLYGIWGGGAVPNNDDIWMDVEYLGASGNPQGSFATLTKASNLAANAALTTDSSTWGGSTTAFKMAVTLSAPQPGLTGYIFIYVKAAKASSTFYIDPLAVLS